MAKKYILSLDQGTTSSRAIVFDKKMQIISSSQREFTQIYPKSGWVEHNAMEIWSSQRSVLTEALSKRNIKPEELAGIGITNQRETTIVWDKVTGEPVYNAIVWQCRRTASMCDKIKEDGHTDYIRKTTGLVIDAYFSATKIKWILDNVKGARQKAERGQLLFGTVDTWLIWWLSEGESHITDHTNASRTMLFNIKKKCWDKKLLEIFGIPRLMLPDVVDSAGNLARASLGQAKVPIAGIAGDQQAALFGQACFEKGSIKNTYGTGCFMLMNTGTDIIYSKYGLLSTIAISLNGKVEYALEGSVFIGGAVLQWLRDGLRLIQEAPDADYFAEHTTDTGGVYFVPAFAGIGSPHWNMRARGAILGLTRGTTRRHIIRAAVESIAYQSNDLLSAMLADGKNIKVKEFKVDGGVARSDVMLQFQADISNVKVVRPKIIESTAMGAAFLAGLGVGWWENKDAIKKTLSNNKVFEPHMDDKVRKKHIRNWNKAVQRTFDWEEE